MKVRFQILNVKPGGFWLGPLVTIYHREQFLETGVSFGWDKDTPFSLKPNFRYEENEKLRSKMWVASCCGFCFAQLILKDRKPSKTLSDYLNSISLVNVRA